MTKLESDPKLRRRPVHGVLLLDKPPGVSSNQALQKCKWLLRAEKAGHTGTLDPLATGVLPLCFGAATKFSQLQLDAQKTYQATLRLGMKTSTGDAEGEVIEERPVPDITPELLAAVAARFTGALRQVPPMHSALKRHGKSLYEYARAGEQVEREPRDIVVHQLDLRPSERPGVLVMFARVSKGTYVRTLGEDIGGALGCGAHLAALRRTAAGAFDLSQCITLDALEAMTEEERLACLRPVESLLADHPRITLDTREAGRFLSGLRRRGAWPDCERVAVFAPCPRGAELGWEHADEPPSQPSTAGETSGVCLLGTAHIQGGELIPDRLLNPAEIGQMLTAIPVPPPLVPGP